MNEIDRLLAARAASQRQVFSRQQAREAGLTRWSLQRRLASGLYIAQGPQALSFAGTVLDWRGRLQAGLLDLGTEALVGGRAAAALYALDGYPEGLVSFVVPRAQRDRATTGKVHSTLHLDESDRAAVDGLPVLRIERLLLQLAAEVTETELANAVDSALRQGRTTAERIVRRELELGRRGWPSTKVDRVLELAGVQSWLERRFLDLVRQAGLRMPAMQRVYRRDGRHIARVDFDWAPSPVIVEVGGRRGYLSVRERQRQERRRNALQAEGKVVWFFTTEDVVEDPAYVFAMFREMFPRAA
jgi:very-short-patch-repair endonuclease